MGHGSWSGLDWTLVGLGMLVFWGFVAVVVLRSIGFLPAAGGRSDSSGTRMGSQPRAILDQRLASGEISEGDYRNLCDLLSRR